MAALSLPLSPHLLSHHDNGTDVGRCLLYHTQKYSWLVVWLAYGTSYRSLVGSHARCALVCGGAAYPRVRRRSPWKMILVIASVHSDPYLETSLTQPLQSHAANDCVSHPDKLDNVIITGPASVCARRPGVALSLHACLPASSPVSLTELGLL